MDLNMYLGGLNIKEAIKISSSLKLLLVDSLGVEELLLSF